MKNTIYIIFIILISCGIQNKNELKVITHVDGCCISGGWSKISIDLKWKSKVVLSYNESKDRMNDIKILNNNQYIIINRDKIKEIRSPDFGTLNDIWFNEFTKEIDSLSFEFNNLNLDNIDNYGRYLAEFEFQNHHIEKIIISKFDDEKHDWVFQYDK